MALRSVTAFLVGEDSPPVLPVISDQRDDPGVSDGIWHESPSAPRTNYHDFEEHDELLQNLRAKVVVCHCWDESFDELVDALEWYGNEGPFWICSFSLYQNFDTTSWDFEKQYGKDPFDVEGGYRAVMQQANQLVVVITNNPAANPLERLFCRAEIACAMSFGKQVDIASAIDYRNGQLLDNITDLHMLQNPLDKSDADLHCGRPDRADKEDWDQKNYKRLVDILGAFPALRVDIEKAWVRALAVHAVPLSKRDWFSQKLISMEDYEFFLSQRSEIAVELRRRMADPDSSALRTNDHWQDRQLSRDLARILVRSFTSSRARHRLAIAQTEAQANSRHEAVTDSPKEEVMNHQDGEIAQLRKEALERDCVQEERIKKLEELLVQQSLQNQKLQRLLDSQLSQPPPVPVVETATATLRVEPYVLTAPVGSVAAASSSNPSADALNASVPAFVPVGAPPYAPHPSLSGPSPHEVDGDAHDIVTNRLTPFMRTDEIPVTFCQNQKYGGGMSKGTPPTNSNENRTPMSSGTIPYGNIDGDPFDERENQGPGKGAGEPGGGGGDDGYGGRGGGSTPPPSPSLAPGPSKPNKGKKKASGRGGDRGGDDDDPGKDSDDSDEKFVRRMRKFLGGGFNVANSDDKPKVKEADTIKLPAISGPETFRNWRIKTREAIVAASTNPDLSGSVRFGRKVRRLKPSGRWRRLQR
eukprot:s251_g10.t1